MRSLIFGIVLLTLFGMIFSAQTLYHSHQENNETFDIYNFTETNFVWNYSSGEEMFRNNLSEMTDSDYGKIQSKRIGNLIHKFFDFFGYSMFEVSKWAMEFGYTHPEYDVGYFMRFVKYWLFAMIIIALFPILIPLIALIYLVVVGIKKRVIRIRTPKTKTQQIKKITKMKYPNIKQVRQK